MNAGMKRHMENVLELFDTIKQRVADEHTAVVLLQEVCKDKRTDDISQDRHSKAGYQATAKQKHLMGKLGIEYPKDVTKEEASVLIDERKSKSE
jgi:hypothetical protein